MNPIYARIRPDSPRYPSWMEIYETEAVEVESSLSEIAEAPEGDIRRFYKIKVKALTQAQRERAIAFVARKFNLPESEVRADIDGTHGLPILADDVTLSIFPA